MLTLGHQFRFRWDLPIFVSALYLHLVDLRRIKKVQLLRKSLFKLFSSGYFSIFPVTSSFCLVCTFAYRCQQSTHPILFFWPQYFGFLFPIILFLRLYPTSLLQASCWPRFYRSSFILFPLHLSTILNSFESFCIPSSVARCTSHLSTSLHTLVVSFSLLLFFLTRFATWSVVLPYYLFYSVLAMKWDYFHSLAVLRSQQFLYVEVPHKYAHTLSSTLSISYFAFSVQHLLSLDAAGYRSYHFPPPRIRFRSWFQAKLILILYIDFTFVNIAPVAFYPILSSILLSKPL